MAMISVPTKAGGRRDLRARAGVSIEVFLHQYHLQESAHRWGVERKTPQGWVEVHTSTVIREMDVFRIRTPTTAQSENNPFVCWLTNLFSSLEKRRK